MSCNKHSLATNCHRASLTVKLAKISAVILFFCFAECAAGSCLSYGPACWGAHGKRNGGRNVQHPDLNNINRDSYNAKWFLSKLLRGEPMMDFRYPEGEKSADMISMNQRDIQQLLSDNNINQMDADLVKAYEEHNRDMDDNSLMDDIYPPRTIADKIKAARFLKKRAAK